MVRTISMTGIRCVVLGIGVLGCSEPRGQTLSGSYGKAKDVSASETTSGAPRTASKVSASVRPPSERLACGQPCSQSEPKVSASGYCDDEVAVRCQAGVVICEDCRPSGAVCSADGGPAECRRDCEGEQVCTGSGCFDRVCCPNAAWCDRGVLSRCDDTGQNIESTPCQLGLDCRNSQCLPAQPFVVVLFDTSDSMNWMPNDENADPELLNYPACDDPADPVTRIGLSKGAFRKLFQDVRYDQVAFALMRFPQRLDPGAAPKCMAGGYKPDNTITGHSGVFTTGDWFGESLAEVVVVPFPPSGATGNRPILDAWLDFSETIRVTDEVCTSHTDCPLGLCTDPNGEGVCRYFENPELRAALGATPLGTTLFYAGEYFRRYVVREGEACAIDRDCLTSVQFCIEGKCKDPNRFCRQRSVVAFTDGVDTASLQAFYQPTVQARRLRAGLDCTSDADCHRGFACDESGTCQVPGGGCGVTASCDRDTTKYPKAVELGASRLLDANGDPLEITVHVVDVSGPYSALGAANLGIATYGGGLAVKPALADSDTLYEGIRGVIDWKDADFCAD